MHLLEIWMALEELVEVMMACEIQLFGTEMWKRADIC